MSKLSSMKTKLYVDLAIFVAFLVVMTPALGGIAFHEWLSVALGAGLVVHLLLSWNWIVAVTRRFFRRIWHRTRLNYVLDALLLISMTTAFLSGFMISRSVLPFFGLRASRDFFWRALHTTSANLTLLIVSVHVALHWPWVTNTLRRYALAPIRRGSRQRQAAFDERPGRESRLTTQLQASGRSKAC